MISSIPRFLQEVTRRSNVPRSVQMLQQLQLYKEKTFPGASYNYWHDVTPAPSERPLHSSMSHKHAPLSARGPARSRPHHSLLLDRPQTSVSVIRNALIENTENEQDDVADEVVYSINNNDNKPLAFQNNRQVTEFPSIRKNNSFDSLRREQTDDGISLSPMVPATPPRKIESGSDLMQRTNSMSKLSISSKQRNDSLSSTRTAAKIPQIPPLMRLNTKDTLPIPEVVNDLDDSDSVDSYEPDTLVETLLAEEIRAFENSEERSADKNTLVEFPEPAEDIFNGRPEEDEDDNLGIIDLDVLNHEESAVEKYNPPKKQVKPSKSKTNFNRLKTTEPVMPLRENITSVLRRERLLNERSRFEQSQSKIKKYMTKLNGSDSLSRNMGHSKDIRDTASAVSRKSSIKNSDTKFVKKSFK